MVWNDDNEEESGRPWWRRLGLPAAVGGLFIALLAGGVIMMLSGDKEPPRKVNELTVTMILPPPPPPPPPPPEQQPEQKVVEQTPVKQEIIEEKAVDIPKEAPPDIANDAAPGPPDLGLPTGPGSNLSGSGRGGGGGGGGGGSRFGWYASIVQAQIEAALRANARTRHAVMRIQVRLWPDATGHISRVQLASSTGNAELDAVIRDQVLGGMQLREPPPKDMPMPIITRVTAQSPG